MRTMHWTHRCREGKCGRMIDQRTKASDFQALHRRERPFLLPNPWDPGTARLLASFGFEALGTTSLGVANMLGRKRAEARHILGNLHAIVDATSLPVSADLENGFAEDPVEAARMIRLAYDCGAVGASIEDAAADRRPPIYGFTLAVERVHAAVEAARALPIPF